MSEQQFVVTGSRSSILGKSGRKRKSNRNVTSISGSISNLQVGQRQKSHLSFTNPKNKNRSRSASQPLSVTEHHTKILASLVPDEIIYDLRNTNIRKYDVALLLGDVSGFTDLCEKYNKSGKGGPSRLTEILNGYIGAMVQEILSGYGDVLKFSGDAFLAWWKSSPEKSIQDVVSEAIDCALRIQQNYGRYETDVQVTLQVKLAIAAGQVYFSIIGQEKMKHYIILGKPIFDVKNAEHLCLKGDVMLSPTAWQYVHIRDYIHEFMPDQEHIKVRGVAAWKTIQNISTGPGASERNRTALVAQALAHMDDDIEELFPTEYNYQAKHESNTNVLSTKEEYSLRPSVNDAAEMKMKELLRPFIFPPVMHGVDMHEPLEYLTEMRQVVIMFVNVVPTYPPWEELVYTVDKTYKIVISLVEENRGAVNKVSMFDKDLMFLIVFGLRGYKHELESQSGLRCAAEVHTALLAVQHIAVVSVGVTSGMTYCGVVGHVLRREYTVIGAPVNKAARLMMAYTGKVTCDRETFLHSQIDARHFILQEAKQLKGLASVGPIYEYNEKTMQESREKHTLCKYPLLGRDRELRLFNNLLDRMLIRHSNDVRAKRFSSNTEVHPDARPAVRIGGHHRAGKAPPLSVLLIQGEPRQGKSRLMDEMIYSAPPNIIFLNRISLTHHDRKSPYSCMQLLFGPVLGMTENSLVNEREDKLMLKLRGVKVPMMLCCFNNVFKVSFDMPPEYQELSRQQRDQVLKDTIKILIHKCFREMWVIAIDDCENVDDESWRILPLLIREDYVFVVLALNHTREISPAAADTLIGPRVRTVTMEGIEKKFHIGLACQMLDVRAIPPELEKEIQARSAGNPGWVESYLVSLLQAGGITMHNIPETDMQMCGLVVATNNMLFRPGDGVDEEDLNQPKNIVIDQRNDSAPNENRDNDDWDMYQSSYNDNFTRRTSVLVPVERRLTMESKGSRTSSKISTVIVCNLAPNFNMSSVNAELTMDVLVMKMFDSLSSYEQMLLKCASVLGEPFPRTMLEALIQDSFPLQTAEAIKHLFEIHVLGCAEGDFSSNANNMIVTQRSTNPNIDMGVRCTCIGIVIDDLCRDLPAYASCGFMRFRMNQFKDTIYSLMTNVRKKESHLLAVKFLERETMRCSSCGGGRFQNILGNKVTNTRKKKHTKRRFQMDEDDWISKLNSNDDNPPVPGDEMTKTDSSLRDIKMRSMTGADGLLSSSTVKVRKDSAATTTTYDSDLLPDNNRCLPAVGLFFRPARSQVSLTRSFSSTNFTNCKCSLILITMYTQILEHCRKAGDISLLMDAILEYVAICVAAPNIPQAVRLLDEAVTVLDLKPKEDEKFKISVIPLWKIPFVLGQIHTLYGYAQLVLGHTDDAYKRLYLAMVEFGSPFPVTKLRARFACHLQLVKLKTSLMYPPDTRRIGESGMGFRGTMSKHMAECLALLCSLFQIKKDWPLAHLAAVWGLNEALQCKVDFYSLCTAYSNMMNLAQYYGNVSMSWRLEISALKICNRLANVQLRELEAIARFYLAVFMSRLYRAEIERATNLGLKTLNIAKATHILRIRLQLLPPLIQALIMSCRLDEAVIMLQELDAIADDDTDISSRMWYFALALDIELDTGFRVVSYANCETFYQEEGGCLTTIRDPESQQRFFANMWLWCVRNDEWEMAAIWAPFIHIEDQPQPTDTMATVLTTLRMLEGMLLYIAETDIRNIKAISEKYLEISTMLERIGKATKVTRVALPRLMHMDAFFREIRFRDRTALKMVARARLVAQKQGNIQEAAWAEHSDRVWKETLAPILMDLWKDHCLPENELDDIDGEQLEDAKMMLFSLPIPKYKANI